MAESTNVNTPAAPAPGTTGAPVPGAAPGEQPTPPSQQPPANQPGQPAPPPPGDPAGNPGKASPPASPTQAPEGQPPGQAGAASPGSQPAPGAAQPTVVPEKYDLKLPSGSQLTPADVDKIASFSKSRGLSQDQAQVVLERENEWRSAQIQELTQRQASWVEQARADQEIGGDAFNKNVELAKRVVSRFGSDALKKELNASKLGDHPELVRLCVRIGRAMGEDTLVIPGAQASDKPPVHDKLFPTTAER